MKILKKLCAVACFGTLLCTTALAADPTVINAGKNGFSVKADGKYLNSDSYIYNQELYVPLRDVCESLGAKVQWDNDSRCITITSGAEKSEAYLGEYKREQYQTINDMNTYFDSVTIKVDENDVECKSFIFNDKTYVNLAAIEPIAGHIYLDNTAYTLRVYSPDYITDDSFGVYGANKLSKDDFMEVVDFVYQGNYQNTLSDGLSSVDNYLLYNDALVKTVTSLGIDMSDKKIDEFAKENPISAISPSKNLTDTEGVKNNIIKYYYAYSNLQNADMENIFKPTDEEINAYYDTIKYSKQLTMKAQHILISKGENNEGLEKINDLLTKAKEKDCDFTKLMLDNTEDPGSASMPDGYIFTDGEMVQEFYDAALKTPVGEVSDVFESQYGYHILKKVAQWDNGVPLEEMKKQIVSSYNNTKLNEVILNNVIDSDVCFDSKSAMNEIITVLSEQSKEEPKDKTEETK